MNTSTVYALPRQVIIAGSSGYIGRHLVAFFVERNVEVFCLQRKPSLPPVRSNLVKYFFTDLEYDLGHIFLLFQQPNQLASGAIFYNCAWNSGESGKLLSQQFDKQLANVNITSNCVKLASQLGCAKFINIGSLLESYYQAYLDSSLSIDYLPDLIKVRDYSIAKHACRDFGLLISYLCKIDYIHVRFSACVSSVSSPNGYIENTLSQLSLGLAIDPPISKLLYDVIPIYDLCLALGVLGVLGRNKEDYFIGTGCASNLSEFFTSIRNKCLVSRPISCSFANHYMNTSLLQHRTCLDFSSSISKIHDKVSLK